MAVALGGFGTCGAQVGTPGATCEQSKPGEMEVGKGSQPEMAAAFVILYMVLGRPF